MDYRALLVKYIARVMVADGVPFIDVPFGMGNQELTEEERDELRNLVKEALADN